MLNPKTTSHRVLNLLDGFWKFCRDPDNIGETENWMNGFTSEYELAVPGSWNEQCHELEQYFGIGWYNRSLEIPEEWAGRGATVHFGCVQNHAKVWLNGYLAGEHEGGFLPFSCDVSEFVIPGQENRLVVKVDASINPWDLPPAKIEIGEGFHNSYPAVTYDFFPYGGIPRPVVLQLTPQKNHMNSIRIDSDLDLIERTAEVVIRVTTNHPVDAIMEVTIENEVQSVAIITDDAAEVRFHLQNPRIWDIGQPNLYQARFVLSVDGEIIDSYSKTFGIRKVEVTADSLLLNGRPVFLRGFGKHEDFPVLGRGLSLPLVVRDFDLLKWIGANSFRTSHYPYAEEWYDFADRHGVLIIGETPLVGLCKRLFKEPNVLKRAKQVIIDMIERDHHHPSVIMWSVANEPWIESPSDETFIRELLAEVRIQDNSRPVTYVAHNGVQANAPCTDCDVVCFNRYGGWYDHPGDIRAGTEILKRELEAFRHAFGKPVLLSEFGADAIPGAHAIPATMFSEEFQTEIIEEQIKAAESVKGVIGTHVWAFSDFKTGQSITRAVRNHKGVFTRERSPKMAAHRIRKLWQSED